MRQGEFYLKTKSETKKETNNMKIDDIKLQLYVDGELDKKEHQEVERFIQENFLAKKKVEEYRQINNLLFEKYKSIEQKNIPERNCKSFNERKRTFF